MERMLNESFSDSRFERKYDDSQLGIITINENGDIIKQNQHFVNLLNLNNTPLVHLNVFNIPVLAQVCIDIGNCMEKQDKITGVTTIKQGKSKIRVKHQLFPIFNANNEIVNILATFENTAEKEKNMIDDKEEKRNYLNEDQLDLESIMYKSAHNLKGPATSIAALSKIAISEVKDATALEYLKMIKQSSERLEEIISDLLNINKIKQGEFEWKLVDLHQITYDVIQNLKYLDGFEEVDITTNFKHSQELISDRKHLYSIFQNLIENAIKYKKPDTVGNIVISSTDVSGGIEIAFADNGAGIPEEAVEKIFNMFYRASQLKTGSGLGLYIVRSTLQKLGGHIKVSSKLGLGTTFTLFLPL